MSDFDAFWAAYPRREGQLAAKREYIFARRTASAEAILEGVARYMEHLPRDRQYIKKPANWLRDGCWSDEYDAPQATKRECPHTPRCHSPVWCDVVSAKERGIA